MTRGKYEIIYADFPWPYTACGTAKLPYPCMSEAECAAFNWSYWMAPRCVVFAWGTGPKLDLQFRCVEAWKQRHGLRYIGVPYVWIKIVELFGDRPRIELFARERVDGWDGWGDEYPPCTGP